MASDHLICCICSEKYNNKNLIPKGLPCLHTFCRQCLVLFLQKHHDKDQLPCPACRKLFPQPENGVDDLPTNRVVRDLIDQEQTEVSSPATDPSTDSLADQDEFLWIKDSLKLQLADTVENATRSVAGTATRLISEVVAWQDEVHSEIDKIKDLMNERIEKEYKLVAETIQQGGDLKDTSLFQNVSSPISVTTDVQLVKNGQPIQRILRESNNQEQNLNAGEDMNVQIDVSRDAMQLHQNISATFSVSQNGTVLLQMKNGDKLLLYKYHDNQYHYENRLLLGQEMKGCKAFLTPNGIHIALSRIKHSGSNYFSRKVETETWIMTLEMEKDSYQCGSFGDLLCVSDERLLYKHEDAKGTLISVYNFKHESMWNFCLPPEEKKVVLSAVLNPVTHGAAVIVEQKVGKEQRVELVMFDSRGTQYETQASDYRKIEHGSKDFVVVLGKDGLRFYNWKGVFARSFNFAGIKCPFRIASFPPDCVCESIVGRNRILHVLTKSSLLHYRCMVACRVDF